MFIHRGLLNKNLRENHISAFKKCIEKNYNIETDVHFSKNNILVCFHDFHLKKLFNKKKIKDLTSQDLKKYNITKLKDLLKIIKHKTKILLEIKPSLNQKTLGKLEKVYNKYRKNILFISFIEKNLIKIKNKFKKVKLGYIFKRNSNCLDIKKKLNKKHINFFVLPKNFEKIKKIKKVKIKKFFYTIRNIKLRNIKNNYIVENIIQ
jgi:glycerophosphoryl diester phosphodiesterase